MLFCCGGACVCVWCVVKLGTHCLSLSLLLSLLPLLFPFRFPFLFLSYLYFLSSFSFSFSLAPSLTLALALLLSLFLLSLSFLLATTMERTDQPTRRPTSRHLNVIWRRASAQQSVLSLLLSPPSSLLPLPSSKKMETSFYRNISGEGIILHHSFKLIQKNQRRVKLQTLQFYINSKTINLHRVKSFLQRWYR